MAGFGFQKDMGEWVAVNLLTGSSAAILSTLATSTSNSSWVDRSSTGDLSNYYHSGQIVMPVTAELQAAEQLTFNAHLEDATSSTGAGTANFSSTYSVTLGSTAATAGTYRGVIVGDLNLTEANQFIRVAWDMTASTISTGGSQLTSYAILLNLAGGDTPAT